MITLFFKLIPRLLIFSLFYLCYSNDVNDDSFFPLIKGSYWSYQDSLYDAEYAEDVSTSTISMDSITNVVKTDSGILASVSMYIIADGKRKFSGYLQYLCNDKNEVFERIKEKGIKWTSWELNCKEKPNNGDTVFVVDDTLIYKEVTLRTTPKQVYCMQSAFCEPTSNTGRKYFYAKGVGLIGKDFCNSLLSSNLIEYRIGNGPIIKKHWLMESPDKK
jgi:hypothetical protein